MKSELASSYGESWPAWSTEMASFPNAKEREQKQEKLANTGTFAHPREVPPLRVLKEQKHEEQEQIARHSLMRSYTSTISSSIPEPKSIISSNV